MEKQTSREDRKKLIEEVRTLKRSVTEVAKNKEEWFKKKEDLKVTIREKIKKIKGEKSTTDKKPVNINDLKKKRDQYNNNVKELIKDIKQLNSEKIKISEKYGFKTSPERIEKQIDELEQKVEVEVSFKKEQELMEKIKKLKKEYENSHEIKATLEKYKKVSKELEEVKKKAQDLHNQIKEITKDGGYKDIINQSKEISTLKKTQEKAFEKFIEFKNKYTEENKALKIKQKALNAVKKETPIKRDTHKSDKKKADEKILADKTAKVEEKIKKGQKLTNEDILAMQAK